MLLVEMFSLFQKFVVLSALALGKARARWDETSRS